MGMQWQSGGWGAERDDIYYLEPPLYQPRHAAPSRLLRVLHRRPGPVGTRLVPRGGGRVAGHARQVCPRLSRRLPARPQATRPGPARPPMLPA